MHSRDTARRHWSAPFAAAVVAARMHLGCRRSLRCACSSRRRAAARWIDGLDEIADAIVLLSMPSDIGHVSRPRRTCSSAERSVAASWTSWSARLPGVGASRVARSWCAPRRRARMPLKPDFRMVRGRVPSAGEEWRVYADLGCAQRSAGAGGRAHERAVRRAEGRVVLRARRCRSLALLRRGRRALKLVVRWSLKPVVTIQSAITSRDALDLTPLPDAGTCRTKCVRWSSRSIGCSARLDARAAGRAQVLHRSGA